MPTALEKALAEAAALAKAAGIDLDVGEIKTTKEIRKEDQQRKEKYSITLEGVLQSLHHAHSMTVKYCGWCREKFMTNYCFQQFCSDECRIKEFIEHFKVDPRMLKPPPSFWEYEPTATVEPVYLARMYEWAKTLVGQFETLDPEVRQAAEDELASEQLPDEDPLEFSFGDPTDPSDDESQSSSQEESNYPPPTTHPPEPDTLGSLDFSF